MVLCWYFVFPIQRIIPIYIEYFINKRLSIYANISIWNKKNLNMADKVYCHFWWMNNLFHTCGMKFRRSSTKACNQAKAKSVWARSLDAELTNVGDQLSYDRCMFFLIPGGASRVTFKLDCNKMVGNLGCVSAVNHNRKPLCGWWLFNTWTKEMKGSYSSILK